MPKKYANIANHTATHEAGHAVIGRLLGLRCGSATIIPNYKEGSAGHAISPDPHISIAEWEARGRWRYVSMFRAAMMMLMAGREAEIECLGYCQGGDERDQYEIACHIDEAEPPAVCSGPDENRDRFEARLRTRTRGLVRRHRGLIELVAKALLERKKLSGRQIDAIVKTRVRLPTRVDLRKCTAEKQFAAAIAWQTKRKVIVKKG
jgi:hypothetical protein